MRASLALWFAAFLCSAQTFRFEDFPAKATSGNRGKAPRLVTAGQRKFRSRILEGAKKGPNFAGHFTIVQWGCGAGCVQLAVADADTGTVYEGPFGALPNARLAMSPDIPTAESGLLFHADSRLLLANGCPNEQNCGRYAYEWDGKVFRRLTR